MRRFFHKKPGHFCYSEFHVKSVFVFVGRNGPFIAGEKWQKSFFSFLLQISVRTFWNNLLKFRSLFPGFSCHWNVLLCWPISLLFLFLVVVFFFTFLCWFLLLLLYVGLFELRNFCVSSIGISVVFIAEFYICVFRKCLSDARFLYVCSCNAFSSKCFFRCSF